MARAGFSIKIDVDQLAALANRLGTITPEKLGEFVTVALNQTADSAYELGRKRMLNGINLTDEYVKRKMKVEHATSKKPIASITAFGSRGFLTNLSHYGAMQTSKRVRWTNQAIVSSGIEFGPWPGWTRRTGNERLGIPVDYKAAGVQVQVVKGRAKTIKSAFGIPGKKDAEGNQVVFRREGDSVKALSGPSVYQLFRTAAGQIEGQVAADLEQAVINAAETRLREIL